MWLTTTLSKLGHEISSDQFNLWWWCDVMYLWQPVLVGNLFSSAPTVSPSAQCCSVIGSKEEKIKLLAPFWFFGIIFWCLATLICYANFSVLVCKSHWYYKELNLAMVHHLIILRLVMSMPVNINGPKLLLISPKEMSSCVSVVFTSIFFQGALVFSHTYIFST